MRAEVFDDWKSVIHTAVGGLSYFFPFIAVIFILYEVAEHFIKHEPIEFTRGDILEFCLGYTLVGLCWKCCVSPLVSLP